jgi:hypothetical protein
MPPDSSAPPATTSAPTSTQSGVSNQSSASSDQQNKIIEGCLSQNSTDNSFALVDDAGNHWRLSGDTSSLASLVGQQVQVTGSANQSQVSSSSSSTSSSDMSASSTAPKGSSSRSSAEPGAASSNADNNQVSVKSAKSIASVCRKQSQ